MLSHMIQHSGVTGGWLALAGIGMAVVAYFLGCFNGAVVVSRYILRDDVRAHGSGNAGLTNFHRTFGGKLTAVVLLSDVLKAVLAVGFSAWIASLLSPALVPLSKYWSGLFCLLGHMYPCTFQFRGGKGILSGGTIAIMIDWRVALVVWGGFALLAGLTRYVSLGSCWAGLSFPFVSGLVYQDTLVTLLAIAIGGLILWKHRGNIQRLVQGTEAKFALHRGSAAPKRAAGPADTAPAAEDATAPAAPTDDAAQTDVHAAQEETVPADTVAAQDADPMESPAPKDTAPEDGTDPSNDDGQEVQP